MIQRPFLRMNVGTLRFAPNNFCVISLTQAKGQIPHQKRPSRKKKKGIRGHQRTQVAAVPKLSWASVGPANVSNMMTAKTSTVIHVKDPGEEETFKKTFEPRDIEEIDRLLFIRHLKGLYFLSVSFVSTMLQVVQRLQRHQRHRQ